MPKWFVDYSWVFFIPQLVMIICGAPVVINGLYGDVLRFNELRNKL